MLAVAVWAAPPSGQKKEEEEPQDCVIRCPNIYLPICGTDGENSKVFTSQCVMKRQSCLEHKGERPMSLWSLLTSILTGVPFKSTF